MIAKASSVIRQPGLSVACKRRVEHQFVPVEHQPPAHADTDCPLSLFELPVHQTAETRQPKRDAIVMIEVMRRRRLRVLRELRQPSYDGRFHVRRDSDGDHVLRHVHAETDAYIEALRHEVSKPVFAAKFDFDVGILRHPWEQPGPDQRAVKATGEMIDLSGAKRGGTPDQVGTVGALLMDAEGGFITGSDFLVGGVTASYWHGELASK